MFGKLSLAAIPYHNLITISAVGGAVVLGLVILGLITYYRKWTYLYKEWLTSLDHKKIGIMYIILAVVQSTSPLAWGPQHLYKKSLLRSPNFQSW